MPQFDLVTLFVQIFYTFAFLISLYVLSLRLVLVHIAEVLKMRKKLVTFQQKVDQQTNLDFSSRLYTDILKVSK
jgi:hypothetical protein